MLIGFYKGKPVTNSGTGGRPTIEVEKTNVPQGIPVDDVEWVEFPDDSEIVARIRVAQCMGGSYAPVKNESGEIIDIIAIEPDPIPPQPPPPLTQAQIEEQLVAQAEAIATLYERLTGGV